jgi:hypothetical protein
MLIIQRAVDDQVRKQAESWRAQTVQQMYAVVLSNLHDKYGFTPEQLVKFFEQCTKDFKAMADKYVKIEDFYGLLNEMGIKVK